MNNTLLHSKENKFRKYPSKTDNRVRDNIIFPHISPKFSINIPSKVFTMGSCFARNIEDALDDYDINLPTKSFKVLEEESLTRPNGILNQYNPGTMYQNIMWALTGELPPIETLIATNTKGSYQDLLLACFSEDSLERALERRKEICTLYQDLFDSDCLVITLGLTECWFDTQTQCYLNMIRPIFLKQFPGRFKFMRLDVFDIMPLLESMIKNLTNRNNSLKIILTVSPVPLGVTFTTQDCVVSNSFSKSVLRVCAERICNTFDNVDYFPSYEMVTSAGPSGFIDDNIHVDDKLVRKITQYMIEEYVKLKVI